MKSVLHCENNWTEVKLVKGGSLYSTREIHLVPVNIHGDATSSGAKECEDGIPVLTGSILIEVEYSC